MRIGWLVNAEYFVRAMSSRNRLHLPTTPNAHLRNLRILLSDGRGKDLPAYWFLSAVIMCSYWCGHFSNIGIWVFLERPYAVTDTSKLPETVLLPSCFYLPMVNVLVPLLDHIPTLDCSWQLVTIKAKQSLLLTLYYHIPALMNMTVKMLLLTRTNTGHLYTFANNNTVKVLFMVISTNILTGGRGSWVHHENYTGILNKMLHRYSIKKILYTFGFFKNLLLHHTRSRSHKYM
jgi:hypothetical protein